VTPYLYSPFVHSLYHFHGAMMTIKGSLQPSIIIVMAYLV